MRPLKTMVHVESRSRLVMVRKTSATPASPAFVATRMCSTYFDLGGASWIETQSMRIVDVTKSAYLDLRATLYRLLERI